MRGKHTFSKNERLSGKRRIDELFEKGSSFYFYPFKIVFLKEPSAESLPDQVLISVPKKYWKRAVDRNLIKRRIREAYRLEKKVKMINNETNPSTRKVIGLIYISKVLHTYSVISESMASILQNKKFE